MAPFATPLNTKRRGVRWGLAALAALGLGALLALYAPEIIWTAGGVPARLGKSLGGQLTSRRVRYDWFQAQWRVTDLELRRPGLSLKTGDLRLGLDLFRWLRGGDPLVLLRSVEVENWTLELNPTAPSTPSGFPAYNRAFINRMGSATFLATEGHVVYKNTSVGVDMVALGLGAQGELGFYFGVGRNHLKGSVVMGEDGVLGGTAEAGGEGFKPVAVDLVGEYATNAWRLLIERQGGDGGLSVAMDSTSRDWRLRYYHLNTPLSETLAWFGRTNLSAPGLLGDMLTRLGTDLGTSQTRTRLHVEYENGLARVGGALWRPGIEEAKFFWQGKMGSNWTANGSWWGKGQLGFQLQGEGGMVGGRLWARGLKLGQTPLSGDVVLGHQNRTTRIDLFSAGAQVPILRSVILHQSNQYDFNLAGGAGGLSLEGSVTREGRILSRLKGEARGFSLGPLADALAVPLFREWVIDGTGAMESPGVFTTSLRAVHGVTGREVAKLDVRADDKFIRIRDLSWGQNAKLWGESALGDGGRSAFTLVSGGQTNFFAGVRHRKGLETTVSLRGLGRGGEAEWRQGPERWQLTVKEWPLMGAVHLSGEAAGEAGAVTGKLRLNGLSPYDEYLTVESEFQVGPGGVELGSLHLSDAENHLWGFGTIRWGERLGYRVSLGGVKEPVRLEAEGEFSGGEHRSRILLQQADLSVWKSPLRKLLPGRTRAHLVLTGPVMNPNLSLRFLTDPLRVFRDPHRLQGEIEFWDGTWQLRRLELEKPDFGGTWKPVAHIQRARVSKNEIEVTADLTGFPTLWPTDGKVSLTWDRARRTAVFSTSGLVLGGQAQAQVRTLAVQDDQGWTFSAPDGEGLVGVFRNTTSSGFLKRASPGSTMDLAWHHQRKIVARLEGKTAPGAMDLVLSTAHFRAGFLRPLFNLTEDEIAGRETFDMDLAGRHVTGVNLAAHIHGSPEKPLISGRALITGRFRFFGTTERFDRVRVPIEIEDNVFTLRRGQGLWNDGGEVSVDGTVSAKGLTGVDGFDLRITGKDFRADWKGGPLEVQGKVNGEVVLGGSGFYPKISGRLSLSDGGMVMAPSGGGRGEDWSERQKRFYNRIAFDLALVAGSRSRLESPVFEMQLIPGGEARFSGTLYNDEWGVAGTLQAQAGTFVHQGTDFRVKRMTLNFPKGGSPADPWVEVDAVTKVREGSGVSIDISLLKKGRLGDPQVSISAIPGRTPDEIRILLGWADPKEIAGGRSGLSAGSRVMANAMLFRPLERSLRRGLGLDYVRIDTDLWAVAEAARRGSNSGSLTTTFSMGKYLAENLFFQSDFNLGLGTTNTFGGALNLEYDLGIFNLGGRVEVRDLTRLPGTPKPVDFSVNLNKNWSF